MTTLKLSKIVTSQVFKVFNPILSKFINLPLKPLIRFLWIFFTQMTKILISHTAP